MFFLVFLLDICVIITLRLRRLIKRRLWWLLFLGFHLGFLLHNLSIAVTSLCHSLDALALYVCPSQCLPARLMSVNLSLCLSLSLSPWYDSLSVQALSFSVRLRVCLPVWCRSICLCLTLVPSPSLSPSLSAFSVRLPLSGWASTVSALPFLWKSWPKGAFC